MGRKGKQWRMTYYNRVKGVVMGAEDSDTHGCDERAACEQSMCGRGGFTGSIWGGGGHAMCATTVGLRSSAHSATNTTVQDVDTAAAIFDVKLEYASQGAPTNASLHLTLLRPPFSGECSSVS